MIQIYVEGPHERGFLEIGEQTELAIESYADIFDEDFATSEVVLNCDFPWTDINRRILGFAERLENFNTRPDYYICTLYEKNFPVLSKAKITILEKNGYYTYKKGSFSTSINGVKGIFGSRIKSKKLTDLTFSKISWSTSSSRKFATDVMKGIYPEYSHIVFAPMLHEGFIQTDRKDYNNEFIAQDIINNVVITGGISQWVFGRPTSANTAIAAVSGTAEYVDYRTVPFIKLKWLLQQIFSQFGFTAVGDFFNTTDFDDVVVYNNYAIEVYSYTTFVDFNRSITLTNHLPDVKIVDFLKSIFSFFNLYPSFTSNTVVLYNRNKIIAQRNSYDVTNYVIDTFTSTFENDNYANKKGYTLKLNDTNDGYRSDWIKDIKNKTLVGSVNSYDDLSTFSISRSLTTDDIVYVEADNMYYVVADATSTPIVWDVYSQKFGDYVTGDGERNVDINAGIFLTALDYGNTTGVWYKQAHLKCATRQPGSYINSVGITVKNNTGTYLMYAKKVSIGGINVPCTFTNNRDSDNNKIVPYSLAFYGTDGLAQLHNTWQDLRQKSEVVKTYLIADSKLLNDIEKYNLLLINNVTFLIYYINRPIPLQNTIEVKLVPL